MRRHHIAGFVAAAIVAATTTWLLAQPVVQNTVTGLECWNAGQGPGGPSTGFLCAALMRNGTGMTPVTASGAATTVANQNQSTLLETGGATSWAITLPNPAFDGEIMTISATTTITTGVTVTTTNTPQAQVTLAPAFASQTLTAGTSDEWQFSLANLAWYRLR